jgi:hypothetical protein
MYYRWTRSFLISESVRPSKWTSERVHKVSGGFLFPNCYFYPENSNDMFLWNAGIYLQVHMALLPKRPASTSSTPRKLQISRNCTVLNDCKVSNQRNIQNYQLLHHNTTSWLLSVVTIIIINIIIYINGFFLVLFLLNQQWTQPLRLQVSDCSTFLIMCDVPSTAVLFLENLLNAFLVLFPDIF